MAVQEIQREAQAAANAGMPIMLQLNNQLKAHLTRDVELLTDVTLQSTLLGEATAQQYFSLRKAIVALQAIAVHGLENNNPAATLPKPNTIDLVALAEYGNFLASNSSYLGGKSLDEEFVPLIEDFVRKHKPKLQASAEQILTEEMNKNRVPPREQKQEIDKLREKMRGSGQIWRA